MIECKSVKLVRQGTALFPDAPTERGRRHLEELSRIGERATVVFVVQRGDAVQFAPNRETDAAFAAALRDAVRQGVLILAARCHVSFQEVFLETSLPVCLDSPATAAPAAVVSWAWPVVQAAGGCEHGVHWETG